MNEDVRAVRPPEPEFGRHLREMARRWRVIVLVSLACALAVFIIRSAQDPVYSATAVVQVQLPDTVLDDGESTEFRARSLAELAFTRQIIATTSATANEPDLTVENAPDQFRVALRDTPGFLEVTAIAGDPQQAATLAQALAEALAIVGARPVQGITASVVADATVPTSPDAPRPGSEALLTALVAALLTAEGIVVVRKFGGLLNPIEPEAELQRLLGVPTIRIDDDRSEGSMVPFFASNLIGRPIITVVQRGPSPQTEPAARISAAAAGLSRRVLLIDADLAQPVLHRQFGHPQTPGLAEVLAGTEVLRSVVRRASDSNPAAVLSAGSSSTDLAGVDRVLATSAVVSASGADCAVLSTTATSSLDEAMLVAHHFGEAVILSVDPQTQKQSEILEIADHLRTMGAQLIGILLYTAPRGVGPTGVVTFPTLG